MSGWVSCSRCVVKLLGGIGRFERTCGVPVKLLGRDVGCIWPSSCLVAGCALLVGVVKLLGGIGRFERTCGVPVKLLGRDVGCIWPSSCLVAGCALLVGVV